MAKRTPMKAAARPVPQAFAGARERASGKELALFESVRARASVLGAIKGLSAAIAERPLGEGRWTVRESVLHLVHSDRLFLQAVEPALRGTRPEWAHATPEQDSRLNEEGLRLLRHLPWEEALKDLDQARERLMEALESIPETPADPWTKEHPLGELVAAMVRHDRRHADTIKRWRGEQGV